MINELLNCNELIITNSDIKNKLIFENANNLRQIKVKTINEIINECFDLNNIVDYIDCYNEYGEYIFEAKYMEKKVYNITDIVFQYKSIIILDYYFENDIFNYLLEIIKNKVNIKFKYHYEVINKTIYVNEYDNQKEEVFSVTKRISKLIYNKTPINKIYLIYTNKDYDNIINEAFNIYNLPYSLNKSNRLSEYKSSKKIIEFLYSNLNNKFDDVLINYEFYVDKATKQLVDLLNEFIGYGFIVNDIIKPLIYKINKTVINIKENKGINILNDYNVLLDNDSYIFVIGVNQDIIPKVFKDDDYLKDTEKEKLGIKTSTEKNKYQKKKFTDFALYYKHIYFSFSNSSMSRNLVKSSILQELENTMDYQELNDDLKFESYSFRERLIKYNKLLDNYKKYKEITDEFIALEQTNLKDYKKYDSTNKVEKSGKIKDILDKGMLLSYTSISEYYKCPFSFYLNRVLKIKKESNLDSIVLGNLFHDSLYKMLSTEKKYNEDEVKELIYQYYRENNITSNPSLNVFLDIYCYYLYNVYLFILKITKRTIFKIKGLEKEYKIPLSVNGYVLNGKIDKVSTCIIKGKEYAVVLDYKTGTSNIDLNKIIHGHDMQLLFYFYFLSQEQEVSFAGGYLQHILPNIVLQKDKNKKYNELLNDFYKYTGYSNSDLTVLSSIDREFDNESYLKGIAVTKKNIELTSNARKRTITDEEYQKLLQIVYKKIEDACNNIFNCEFQIKPSYIDSLSCDLCIYNDICYYNEKDINRLIKYKDLSFLKEDCDDSKETK